MDAIEVPLALAAAAVALGSLAAAVRYLTFVRYARVPPASGATGESALTALLALTGIHVGILASHGRFDDFYNPANRTINLSRSSVHNSLASIVRVAYAVAQAQQHAQRRPAARLRGWFAPAVGVGSWSGIVLVAGALALRAPLPALLGAAALAAAALAALLTLPADAAAAPIALDLLARGRLLSGDEPRVARAIVRGAVLGNVAALAAPLVRVLR